MSTFIISGFNYLIYCFFQGVELDLRLYSRDIIKRALPILVAILEKETRGWFLHFRERLISELRQQKLPDEEIEKVCIKYI